MANALYCRNGHFNGYAPDPNPSYGYERSLYYWQVEQVQEELKRLAFCPTCGVDNINGCLHCEVTIESDPELHPDRPAYCGACGKPFPWTETALATAREYTDELEELSAEDRTTLKATFTDLTVDSPKTEIAASRFKRILRKLAPDVAETIRKTIVEIASETAVKLLKR